MIGMTEIIHTQNMIATIQPKDLKFVTVTTAGMKTVKFKFAMSIMSVMIGIGDDKVKGK